MVWIHTQIVTFERFCSPELHKASYAGMQKSNFRIRHTRNATSKTTCSPCRLHLRGTMRRSGKNYMCKKGNHDLWQ